jgi:CheY-like chemotaxis protein
LVELMDGSLEVSSTVGVGSTFCCDLPVAQPPQLATRDNEDPALPKPEATCVKPLRTLLYVEDNPANLLLVEQLIARRTDMQLLSATNGTLGIELARVHLPHVILMDINLPGISGITALKRLREDPATAHIPVVALSANAMPHDLARGLEVGFFGYLTKPIKLRDFTDMLNAALEFAEKQQIGEQLP